MYVCITTYPYVCTHSLMMYVYDDLILYLYIEDGGMCCITCIRPSLILCHFRANFYAYAHELNHARAPSLFTASGETWLRQQSSRAYHAQFRPRLLCRARLARLLNRRSFHLLPPPPPPPATLASRGRAQLPPGCTVFSIKRCSLLVHCVFFQ
jgi:hypothetical protein